MIIKLKTHAGLRAKERGVSEQEIIEVINTGKNIEAKYDRFGKEKIFEFNKIWAGKIYN